MDTAMAQAVQADVFAAGEKAFVYRLELHVEDLHDVACLFVYLFIKRMQP
jgi:hypothetical protein